MITCHMVGNAHIDPVWRWRWPAGVIEALSTCRSAADLLDEFPEFVFSRSDVWLYERIERYDQELFGRIRKHVEDGRWQPVGGWYIQPDCNLPTAESFRRHMQIGREYFNSRFGMDVTVGFNVDSFGHAATLPKLFSEFGYDSYVMMRPMEQEKRLPSNLFRWRSPGGGEVLTWRIPLSYVAGTVEAIKLNIEAALASAVGGTDHVMCFYGVGDHGGGPTAELIRWIIENENAYPSARLEFSHPRRFFDCVLADGEAMARLPVVEGELQKHAIGCYSVVADIKRDVKRSEYALLRAEASDSFGGMDKALDDAWKLLLFNQFHDTLGGSSIEEAYVDSSDQLRSVVTTAEQVLHDAYFSSLVREPEDRLQRVVIFNPNRTPFSGPVYHEPWLEIRDIRGTLIGSDGLEVPYQVVRQSDLCGENSRGVVWQTEIPAASKVVYRLDIGSAPSPVETDLLFEDGLDPWIANSHWKVRSGIMEGSTLLSVHDNGRSDIFAEPGIHVSVREDRSDTWSHNIDRYDGPVLGTFAVYRNVLEDRGPVMTRFRTDAAFGKSSLHLWVSLFRGDPVLYLDLDLDWHERFSIAKIAFPFPGELETRIDGIPGGNLVRNQDGTEYPLTDWTIAGQETCDPIGIVCPDCFALDGDEGCVRPTLLRSPPFAWHDPHHLDDTRAYRFTDQGLFRFRFRLIRGADPGITAGLALRENSPPVCLDWTRGMKR